MVQRVQQSAGKSDSSACYFLLCHAACCFGAHVFEGNQMVAACASRSFVHLVHMRSLQWPGRTMRYLLTPMTPHVRQHAVHSQVAKEAQ